MSSAARKRNAVPASELPAPINDPIMAAFLRAPVDPEDETPEQRELIAAGERLPKVSGRAVTADIAARRCRPGKK